MSANKRSPWVSLTAFLVYFFLYAPIIVLMVFSFNSSRTNIVFEGIVNKGPCGPFFWFCELASNRDALEATQSTLIVAFTSTLISCIIGTMAAIALQRYKFRLRTFAEAALYIPIVIPEIVMGIGILVFFSAIFSGINSLLGLTGGDRISLGLATVTVSHVARTFARAGSIVGRSGNGFGCQRDHNLSPRDLSHDCARCAIGRNARLYAFA